jgi:ABC-type antimicrobial peptide transport system permease subunit
MIVREGVMLAAVGVTLGLAGALALSRFIRSILFAVEPADPWTLIGVVVTLSAAALVASAIPARRATRVNPLNAIRAE